MDLFEVLSVRSICIQGIFFPLDIFCSRMTRLAIFDDSLMTVFDVPITLLEFPNKGKNLFSLL